MLQKGGRYLFISGALSDGVLEALMEKGLYPVVIVKDATRLFITERVAALFVGGRRGHPGRANDQAHRPHDQSP